VQSENEKAALQKAFEDKRAALEKDLADTKIVKARFENACNALRDRETSYKEEKKELRDARERLDNDFRKVGNEKRAVDRALASAEEGNKKQTTSINNLENDNKRLDDELARLLTENLYQTVLLAD
jgi:chromosome segregation ATPase